jgi:GTPase SAR1 family protein
MNEDNLVKAESILSGLHSSSQHPMNNYPKTSKLRPISLAKNNSHKKSLYFLSRETSLKLFIVTSSLVSSALGLSFSNSSLAQTPQPVPVNASAKNNIPDPFVSLIVPIITAIGGGIGLATGIVSYRTAKIKLNSEKNLETRLFSSEETSANERRNAIIIVGIGGTGKTTLINRLFDENSANPRIATDCYKLYTVNQNGQNIKYNYYVSDCSGQNIGTLISGLMLEQKQLNSPMTFGAINSVIIVVDVAEAPGVLQSFTSEQVINNFQERVQQHLTEWSNTALDSIFGLTGSSANGLKYICLFINKTDLLNGSRQEIEDMVTQAYRPLIDRVSKISRGVIFECLIGSIQDGTNILRLQEGLKNHSSTGSSVVAVSSSSQKT